MAQKTSVLARNLGITIYAFGPYLKSDNPAWKNIQKSSLEDLLKTSDVISIHTTLNDSTYHLLVSRH